MESLKNQKSSPPAKSQSEGIAKILAMLEDIANSGPQGERLVLRVTKDATIVHLRDVLRKTPAVHRIEKPSTQSFAPSANILKALAMLAALAE